MYDYLYQTNTRKRGRPVVQRMSEDPICLTAWHFVKI